MKKALLFISFLVLQATGPMYSQVTKTSINNGNWLNPTTWDCLCYPLPGDNLVINHAISLDTSWYSSGNITVNANGSISEGSSFRQWAMTAGIFTNNGFVNISRFSITGGTFNNNDSIRFNQAFYAASNFNNNGNILDVDSFSNNGIFLNNFSAAINCTYYSNLDSVVNSGEINAFAHTNLSVCTNSGQLSFTDFTNTGTLKNTGNINVSNFTNSVSGIVNNNAVFTAGTDFLNIGRFIVSDSASLFVGNDFANVDSSGSAASLINNGFVETGHHWFNGDSVSGNGRFCIADSTINTGVMSGTFDFCDNTPPLMPPPFLDWNTGYVASTITFCTMPCFSTIEENTELKFALFPNPGPGHLEIILYDTVALNSIKIFDLFGKEVFSSISGGNGYYKISDLENGIYFLHIESSNFAHSEKIVVIR